MTTASPAHELRADIAIMGGGAGGVAAALGALALGRSVVLSEESRWLGGQLTGQATPPDEHPWIEAFGCTERYRSFRRDVRRWYRESGRLHPDVADNRYLNPGGGTVSRLCYPPVVGAHIVESMLDEGVRSGSLRILREHRPIALESSRDRIDVIALEDAQSGAVTLVRAQIFLDATETGDLLELGGVEHRLGAEHATEFDEPHGAQDAHVGGVQAITWPFVVSHDPGANYTEDPPAGYDYWRTVHLDLEPAWPGPLLSWTYADPRTLAPRMLPLFAGTEHTAAPRLSRLQPRAPGGSLWLYRRVEAAAHLKDGHDATSVNWPQNDYVEGSILSGTQEDRERHRMRAKELSAAFLHWMRTEAPRPNGGAGYPGLRLRPDLTGTVDGFAAQPYIREARRLRGLVTITENDVSEWGVKDATTRRRPDSIGVGSYRIDLHPTTRGRNYVDIATVPFQIPAGALVPQRVENLLAAGKCVSVTHVANGCVRLHPIEWGIGEAAGLLAAHCVATGIVPRGVVDDDSRLAEFQHLLVAQGVEIEWPELHPV